MNLDAYYNQGVDMLNTLGDLQVENEINKMVEIVGETKVVREKEMSPFKQRFSDAPWFEKLKGTYILLLGAGGIGSWIGFALSRIGCNFTVFDMDTVESHNLGGQLFNTTHINKAKTAALQEVCYAFSGNENTIRTAGMYTEESYTNPIVIAAFDNMKARKIAFNKWKEYVLSCTEEEAKECLFIDGRLLAEDYQVYSVTKDRIEDYEKTLFDDTEVEEVLCTLKATTHCSMGIASEMISCLTNFIANLSYGFDAREIPFRIIKSIPMYSYELADKIE